MSARPHRGALLTVLLAVVAALISAPASASGVAPSVCDGHWHQAPAPTPQGLDASLTDVVALSPTSAWAVGWYDTDAPVARTLIEHWDGSSWTIVPSPNVGHDDLLNAVSATSASDIWAVGFDVSNTNTTRSLVEHFDGKKWRVVASPSPGSSINQLYGVDAASASDVWAVGTTYPVGPEEAEVALTEHFDGTAWVSVPSPNISDFRDNLTSVKVVSPSDVWAAGSSAVGGGSQPIVLHWDGTAWDVMSTPSLSFGGLTGLTLEPSGQLIAVGASGPLTPLAELWNGSSWSLLSAAPPPTLPRGGLEDAARYTGTKTWAVGLQQSQNALHARTLIESWNGATWKVVLSPKVGAYDELEGVASAGGWSWAVGRTLPTSFGDSAVLIDGICPSPPA